ncbi:MAG: M15 family metallopeptidase [Clostridiales bacterium]|nr:M15 family metallopeptidase [Clostridiales bacterium]
MRRKKLRLIILIEAIIFILCISLAYGISKMSEDGKFKAANLSFSTDDENSRFLILVNKDNPLPDDYTVTLKTLNNGYSQVDEDIYDALSQMLSDGSEEGLSFCIASAYRSSEWQEEILAEDISTYMGQGMDYNSACEEALKQVMPPGYSEHETGLALDIVSADYQLLDDNQETTAENIWLRENCWKYGFILRYPADKEDITQISYESWHFRYVEEESAEYITGNGLCLEEYLETAEI